MHLFHSLSWFCYFIEVLQLYCILSALLCHSCCCAFCVYMIIILCAFSHLNIFTSFTHRVLLFGENLLMYFALLMHSLSYHFHVMCLRTQVVWSISISSLNVPMYIQFQLGGMIKPWEDSTTFSSQTTTQMPYKRLAYQDPYKNRGALHSQVI